MPNVLKSENFIWRLFPKDKSKTFAILDGASVEGLLPRFKTMNPLYRCLYRGKLENGINEVAPYLVELEERSEFTDWVLSEGWGNHWGVFLLTPESVKIDALRRHFRKLNKVKAADGKIVLFRYYDPRVLRIFLPICEKEQVPSFFELVESFVCEDEDPNQAVCFTLSQSTGLPQKDTLKIEITSSV